jgi:hypothetical protein
MRMLNLEGNPVLRIVELAAACPLPSLRLE